MATGPAEKRRAAFEGALCACRKILLPEAMVLPLAMPGPLMEDRRFEGAL